MFFQISLVLILARSCFANEWDFLCKGLMPYTKVPHPWDCRKYIQCMDGNEAFLGECAIGTAFDENFQNCLPESIVDCSHISTTFEPTETTSTIETSTRTTNSPIGEWDYLCVGLPANTKTVHPFDCKKFFQCNDKEEALPGDCRADQAFDKEMLFCLPEEMVDCSHIITTIGPSTSTEATSSTENESTMETSTTPIGGDWDYLCDGLPENTIIPHPFDCKKFFQCTNTGEALAGKCREDQAFDKDMLFCLPEEMVDCSHISTTIGPSTSSEATSSTEVETTSTEITSTTTESSTIETTSDASTTETSSSTEISSTSEETTTTEEESTSESSTTEMSSSTSSTASTTLTSIETTSPIVTSTITYPPGTSISPEIPEPGIECPPMSKTQGKPIFLASNIDCAKYYLCYIGMPVALKCQRGTHFNRFEENCDDPFYAHCQAQGFVDPNPFPECPRRGTYNFPKIDNCEYFIHCYEGIGSLQKCAFYYGWDVTKEKCVIRHKAVCAQS